MFPPQRHCSYVRCAWTSRRFPLDDGTTQFHTNVTISSKLCATFRTVDDESKSMLMSYRTCQHIALLMHTATVNVWYAGGMWNLRPEFRSGGEQVEAIHHCMSQQLCYLFHTCDRRLTLVTAAAIVCINLCIDFLIQFMLHSWLSIRLHAHDSLPLHQQPWVAFYQR